MQARKYLGKGIAEAVKARDSWCGRGKDMVSTALHSPVQILV